MQGEERGLGDGEGEKREQGKEGEREEGILEFGRQI